MVRGHLRSGPRRMTCVSLLILGLAALSALPGASAFGGESGAFPNREFYVTREPGGSPAASAYESRMTPHVSGAWTVTLQSLAGSAIVVRLERWDGGIWILEAASRLRSVGESLPTTELLAGMGYRILFTPYGKPGTSVLRESYTGNAPPVACFYVEPSSGMVGQEIVAYAGCSYDPDGSIVNYTWDFGDNATAEGYAVRHGYASGGYWEVSLRVVDDRGAWNRTSRFVYISDVTRFAPPHSNRGDDIDGNGKFDRLVVEASVHVESSGRFEVRATLRGYSDAEPLWVYSNTVLSLWTGYHAVQLTFSGVPIRASGVDGPYRVDLELVDANAWWVTFDTDVHWTAAFSHLDFESLPAVLAPPHSDSGMDTDGDGRLNVLRVEVRVSVRSPASLRLSAAILVGPNTTEDPNNRTALEVIDITVSPGSGDQAILLNFTGPRIRAAGHDGPYLVVFVLYYETAWTELDRGEHRTAAYRAGDFDANGAFLVPPIFEYGIDHDLDGRYDVLAVDVPLYVETRGSFEVHGRLRFLAPASFIRFAWAANGSSLDVGYRSVTLYFPGDEINRSHVDGPYEITIEVFGGAPSYMPLDTTTFLTQPYRWLQFEELRIFLEPPHVDVGVDVDGDGLYNVLALDLRLNVTASRDYRIDVALHDEARTFYVNESVRTWFSAGSQVLRIPFEGFELNRTGIDGPYVADVRITDYWGDEPYDVGMHVTQGYRHDGFDGPPAEFGLSVREEALDADGNGYLELILVTVDVLVDIPGTYVVTGSLQVPLGVPIVDAGESLFLPRGASTVTLGFSGFLLRSSGLDGPYTINLAVWRPGYDWTLLDTRTYVTRPYATWLFDWQRFVLSPPHSDRAVDLDGNGWFDLLEIGIRIVVGARGMYTLEATLSAPSGILSVQATVSEYLSTGIRTLTIGFEGWLINASGTDGPYVLDFRVSTWNCCALAGSLTTAAYAARDFEGLTFRIDLPVSDQGRDTDGDGRFNFLAILVNVTVFEAARFQVEVEVRAGWFGFFATNAFDLAEGSATIEVLADGSRIYDAVASGPYTVNIVVRDLRTGFSLRIRHVTPAYSWVQFQGPSGVLRPPAADRGEDRDDDGRFDVLVVEFEIDVLFPGTFALQGELRAGDQWYFYAYINTFLPEGTSRAALEFDGAALNHTGVDGPYALDVSLRDLRGLVLDRLANHTTAPYAHTDFEEPPAGFARPHSDAALDPDADGAYESLAVDVGIEVAQFGEYALWATLLAGGGTPEDATAIAWDYAYASLPAGSHRFRLEFPGDRINTSAFDGPYFADLRLRDQRTGNEIASDLHVTRAYSFATFEGPEASFFRSAVDSGNDSDGDGLYNGLVVEVGIAVRVGGLYLVSATLWGPDPSQPLRVEAATRFWPNGTGFVLVRVELPGLDIHRSGVDGPYRVELALYILDYYQRWLDGETLLTSSYRADQFDGPDAAFAGPHTDRGEDADGDGRYDALVVNLRISVDRSGEYLLAVDLRPAGFDALIATWWNVTHLEVGGQIVPVTFMGTAIRSFGVDGPYRVVMALHANGTWLDSDAHLTAAYGFRDFQGPAAELAPPHSDAGVDSDGDGRFNLLEIGVRVDVARPGTFVVYGSLLLGGFAFLADENETPLSSGIQTVVLRFEGARINRSGVDGPYAVVLGIAASGIPVGNGTHTTQTYRHTEFEERPVAFSPPHSDAGIDTDGDGLFNVLAIRVRIGVVEAGQYVVAATLEWQGMELLWSSANETLDSGYRSVVVEFNGPRLRSTGANGTFAVELWLYDSSGGLIDYDVHRTASYNASSFDPRVELVPALNGDAAVDSDGDGLFDVLEVYVGVDVAIPSYLEVSGVLYFENASGIRALALADLGQGVHRITLSFDGVAVYLSSRDGPYGFVALLWSDGSLLARVEFLTSAYAYADFEQPGIEFRRQISDQGVDADGDRLYEELVVTFYVAASTPGLYAVGGSLRIGDCCVIDAGVSVYLDAGVSRVDLSFDGTSIRYWGIDGPYTVVVQIGPVSGAWAIEATHTTGPYRYTDFDF